MLAQAMLAVVGKGIRKPFGPHRHTKPCEFDQDGPSGYIIGPYDKASSVTKHSLSNNGPLHRQLSRYQSG